MENVRWYTEWVDFRLDVLTWDGLRHDLVIQPQGTAMNSLVLWQMVLLKMVYIHGLVQLLTLASSIRMVKKEPG